MSTIMLSAYVAYLGLGFEMEFKVSSYWSKSCSHKSLNFHKIILF